MTDLQTTTLPSNQLPRVTASVRRGSVRWVIASLVSVAMLLVMTSVAVIAQTGGTGGPAFVPATAVGYGEIRLDFPGDQHDELAAFMAHFPGFADAVSFDSKLDQLLDQVVSSNSSGAATWTGTVKSWSNGQLAIGVLGIPDTAATARGTQPSVVIGLGVADQAALETQIASLLGSTPVTTESYSGTTITTAGKASYAIADQYLLISPTADDLKSSLDVLAGTTPGLATDPDFVAASADVPADHLVAFYLETASLKPLIEQQLASQPGGAAIVAQLAGLPAWVAGYGQVSSDHLTIGLSTQLRDGSMMPVARSTDIAEHFPAGTLAYVELRDLGTIADTLLAQLKTQMAADPKTADTVIGLEQQLGVTLDKALDFVQDAGAGVSFDGQKLSGGIVATLSDPAGGARRVQTLLGLLRLASASSTAAFSVASADVNGTTVTTITFKPSAGLPADLPFEPSVSVAVADDHLYLGIADFAATAIAQDAATSLAADPRYTAAVGPAGTPNSGLVWVDVAAAAPLLATIATAQNASYPVTIQPFVDTLDTFVATASTSGDILSLNMHLFVK